MEQATPGKKRRGRPLTSDGPVARAARVAGVSMLELARRLGVEYARVKQWDSRGKVPSDFRDALARASKS